jgi:hypothetical protein
MLVFITEVESVYSAVRTESLYKTDTLRLESVKQVRSWIFFPSPLSQLASAAQQFLFSTAVSSLS